MISRKKFYFPKITFILVSSILFSCSSTENQSPVAIQLHSLGEKWLYDLDRNLRDDGQTSFVQINGWSFETFEEKHFLKFSGNADVKSLDFSLFYTAYHYGFLKIPGHFALDEEISNSENDFELISNSPIEFSGDFSLYFQLTSEQFIDVAFTSAESASIIKTINLLILDSGYIVNLSIEGAT